MKLVLLADIHIHFVFKGGIMNSDTILKNSKTESDYLLLKIFKIVPIFSAINLIMVLLTHNWQLTLLDWALASAIPISFIPIIYYKLSKKGKFFNLLSLFCIECIASVIYMRSWFYASLLWSFSLIVCCLYLNERLIKKLLIIKIPLFILVNYLTLQLKSDYVFRAVTKTYVSSCAYFILQFVIIGYLCIYLARKTTGVYNNFISQNEKLNLILQHNQKSTCDINETLNKLSNNISRGSFGLNSISESSTSIAAKAYDLSSKTLASKNAFDTITQQINDTSEKSCEIDCLTHQMNELTVKNKKNMQELVSKMHTLKDTNAESKNHFQHLQASTLEISNALKIINDVSEETNLLSLNASIEAARAGEVGKGFAVVAMEIKKLADQSTQSAKYIEQIISNVTINTESSLSAIKATDEMIHLNIDSLSITLEDFNQMVAFQDMVTRKIAESQNLIQTLTHHMDSVKKTLDNTLSETQETSSDIHDISSILEELNITFQDISKDANEVQNHSNQLATLQETALN